MRKRLIRVIWGGKGSRRKYFSAQEEWREYLQWILRDKPLLAKTQKHCFLPNRSTKSFGPKGGLVALSNAQKMRQTRQDSVGNRPRTRRNEDGGMRKACQNLTKLGEEELAMEVGGKATREKGLDDWRRPRIVRTTLGLSHGCSMLSASKSE